jgi:hypothetical protein
MSGLVSAWPSYWMSIRLSRIDCLENKNVCRERMRERERERERNGTCAFHQCHCRRLMMDHPITQEPKSDDHSLNMLPNEFIRFEYMHKPGYCCFSSKTTIVTNMRLITRVVRSPILCSKQTSSGKQYETAIFLNDIHHVEQLHSAIPSSNVRWWMKCFDMILCSCAEHKINWLDSCHEMNNQSANRIVLTSLENNTQQTLVLKEKF